MRTVLKFDNRSILDIYSFIFTFTIVVILETLIMGESSALAGESTTFPIFLIGSSIGYSLFWLNEIVVCRFILHGKTKQTKYLQGIVFLSRCIILVGLLYFLFVSMDIIYAIITCIVYLGGRWFGRFFSKAGHKKREKRAWWMFREALEPEKFVSKDDEVKSGTNIEIFDLASSGLIVVLGFCIGHFVGKWIGGYYGNAVFGSKIGLVLGFFVAVLVQGRKWAKQRRDAQKAQDVKEDNLLSPNIDSLLS